MLNPIQQKKKGRILILVNYWCLKFYFNSGYESFFVPMQKELDKAIIQLHTNQTSLTSVNRETVSHYLGHISVWFAQLL